MKKLILGFLLTFSFDLQAKTVCQESLLSYSIKGKRININRDICFAQDSYFSKNCKDQNCAAFRKLNGGLPEYLYSRFGVPEKRACKILGGYYNRLTLNVDGNTMKTERCYFREDGSFISTDILSRKDWLVEFQKPYSVKLEILQKLSSLFD